MFIEKGKYISQTTLQQCGHMTGLLAMWTEVGCEQKWCGWLLGCTLLLPSLWLECWHGGAHSWFTTRAAPGESTATRQEEPGPLASSGTELPCQAGIFTPQRNGCLVTKSCPTLCDPMDCSPPGSAVIGTLQARILEWVAISFSRGSSWPRDPTHISCVSCTGTWITYHQGSPERN